MEMIAFINAIRFQQPGWLWALLLTLPLAVWLLRTQRLGSLGRLPDLLGRQRYRHTQWAILRRLAEGSEQLRSTRGSRVWLVSVLVLALLQLALAQPYRLGRQLPMPQQYRDTVFVVDSSVSMVLRDYLVAGERVDRMTMLKSVLIHFIDQLQEQGHDNRVGLVAYSEQPYTLVPLSADYELVKDTVRRLRAAVLTGRSSDLGKALLYVLKRYQQAPLAGASERRPVLVLLSDINRPSRDVDPRAVAAYLKRQGFRLHTIGIGASSYQAEEGAAAGLVYRPANFGLLQTLAEEGGGEFHWADSVASLESAIKAIQTAERREVASEPRYLKIPLYQWPLLAGLVLLMLAQPRRANPATVASHEVAS